jgi:hypothetical protein
VVGLVDTLKPRRKEEVHHRPALSAAFVRTRDDLVRQLECTLPTLSISFAQYGSPTFANTLASWLMKTFLVNRIVTIFLLRILFASASVVAPASSPHTASAPRKVTVERMVAV